MANSKAEEKFPRFLHILHHIPPHAVIPSLPSPLKGTALAMIWFPELSSITLTGP